MEDYSFSLDEDGYPTEEFLKFLREYTYDVMPILDVLQIIKENWMYPDWGFKLGNKRKGEYKLELHTGGWSGNEDTMEAILSNVYFRHFRMYYYKWLTGGHYYFKVRP